MKKTSLLISWLPVDVGLLNALRPYKARARGRRIKELAVLGAEVERLGFRIELIDGQYRVLAPAFQQLLSAATVGPMPAAAAAAADIPPTDVAREQSDASTAGSEAGLGPPPSEDASEFAAAFM